MVRAFKTGNSLAVAIPAEMARKAGIKPGDQFEAVLTERGILFRPVEPIPRLSPAVEEAYRRVLEEHREAFEKIE